MKDQESIEDELRNHFEDAMDRRSRGFKPRHYVFAAIVAAILIGVCTLIEKGFL